MTSDELLVATNLVKHYDISQSFSFGQKTLVRAVDGVDLTLRKGESLGIVGESGCGKSTLVRLLAALEKPTSGELRYAGVEVSKLRARELRRWRRNVQVVFQDPYSSLNPRMRVGEIVAEPLEVHTDVSKGLDIRTRVRELLDPAVKQPPDRRSLVPRRVALRRSLDASAGQALMYSPGSSGFAIDFAYSAIEEAEYAVLDAVLARVDADAAAGAK